MAVCKRASVALELLDRALLSFSDESGYFPRARGAEESGAQGLITKDATQPCEHREVIGEVGRREQEENSHRLVIQGAEWHAGFVSAEDQQRSL